MSWTKLTYFKRNRIKRVEDENSILCLQKGNRLTQDNMFTSALDVHLYTFVYVSFSVYVSLLSFRIDAHYFKHDILIYIKSEEKTNKKE